jgi:cell pole-organizing protein PopZ
MSNPQPEPSMEEILASIRRIISEDGEETAPQAQAPKPRPAAPAAAVRPATAAPPQRARLFEPEPEPETGPAQIEEDKAEIHLETEDVQMIKKNVAENLREDAEEAMLSDTTAAVASKAFQNLSQSIRVSSGEGRTLEDIVTDLLRPMIKDWLDANLATIVEEKVEEEVQRVARRRR